MSRVSEIYDSIKNLAVRLIDKIQESESYTQLQDRYQSLNANSQRLVMVAAALIFSFLLLYYPLSQLMNSQELVGTFESKRSLIRDLFKTSRETSFNSNLSVPPSLENLKNAVETILTSANLIPDQRVGMIQGSVESHLIPSSLIGHVLEVKLAKLNLKQIIDIGTAITGISESVKMKDMTMAANAADTRYYDVTYKLYSLNVPAAPVPPPDFDVKSKSNRNNKKDADKSGDDNQ